MNHVFFYNTWMGRCVHFYLVKTRHQDALWEEGKLVEAA